MDASRSESRRALWLIGTAAAAVIAILIFLFIFVQVATSGCGPGFSTPAVATRDLTTFNAVLASNPKFEGFRATAVHGHQVDVTDSNVRLGFTPASDSSQPPSKYDVSKYDVFIDGRNAGLDLQNAWRETFDRAHPHAWHRRIVSVYVTDRRGRYVAQLGDCSML
jgi:hypothetical protein